MMHCSRDAEVELEVLNSQHPELSEDDDDLESGPDEGSFADERPVPAGPITVNQCTATYLPPAPMLPEAHQMLTSISFWAVSAATSLYTSKRLMFKHSYHYPLSLATRTFTLLLVTCIIRLSVEPEPSRNRDSVFRRWTIRAPKLGNVMVTGWTAMIPAAAAAAASLPLLMQGLLHMPSLLVMAMLSPLAYVVSGAILFIYRPQDRSTTRLLWEVCIAGTALSMVLYDEYRLLVPGLVFGVTGMIAAGASRALFILGSESIKGAHRAANDAYHGFICLVALLGLLISVPLTFVLEPPTPVSAFWSSTTFLHFLNRCSSVAAIFSGVSPVIFSSHYSYAPTSQFSETPWLTLDILTTTCSSLLVLIAGIISTPASFVSMFQIIAYLTATLILLACSGVKGPYSTREMFDDWINCMPKSTSARGTATSSPHSIGMLHPSIVALATIFVSGWILWMANFAAITMLPSGLLAQLDQGFVPKSRFDIVVSMYDEDPASVSRMLSSIKSTSLLATLQPRVIVYTKSASADLMSLQTATGADIVEKIENAGREGGTYLYHIVNKWDDLADQTMFIQAHAHNMRELIPRIDKFLVENTGMLSLGFTGIVCDCEKCEDRWGWEDSWSVIPTLYHAVTSQKCEGSVLLSYKGQFVASGRRIRGVSREVYQGLLEAITSKGGWSHDANAVDGALDTPDAPFFGYTVERLWNVLMQCSDMRIATLCPSLLSEWRRGGNVEDCQCLDSR